MSDRKTSLIKGAPKRIIGLTGGVGMGKTTVSNYLARVHQLPILDADIYAREAVEPGSTVLTDLVERYGFNILLADGTVNRMRLGEIVFNSPPERLWLEQRIHPYVRDRLETELKALNSQSYAAVVMVVPLLFEARMTDLVTEIWVVCCPLEQQVERLMQREVKGSSGNERLDSDQVRARIKSQMAIENKVKQADIILDNSSTLEALLQQVDLALNFPKN